MAHLLKNPIATVVVGGLALGIALYFGRQNSIPGLTQAARGFSG